MKKDNLITETVMKVLTAHYRLKRLVLTVKRAAKEGTWNELTTKRTLYVRSTKIPSQHPKSHFEKFSMTITRLNKNEMFKIFLL